jgi:hypothetical protein
MPHRPTTKTNIAVDRQKTYRPDEAIHTCFADAWIASLTLAMTEMDFPAV